MHMNMMHAQCSCIARVPGSLCVVPIAPVPLFLTELRVTPYFMQYSSHTLYGGATLDNAASCALVRTPLTTGLQRAPETAQLVAAPGR